MQRFTVRDRALLLIIIGLILLLVYAFFMRGNASPLPTQSPQAGEAYDADNESYSWDITTVATGLTVPWDLAFGPEGELYITERPGTLKRRLTTGTIETIATLPQVASIGESGLTGLTLHPKFHENKRLYLYYTYRQSGQILNRVAAFTLENTALSNETPIIDNLPGGSIHNGGRLRFGPDGKLWILTGDAGRPSLAQDKASLAGKVLRVNEDGSIPSDNPFPNSAVYSLGHRNPQGLSWHPLTEELIVTSHGESAYDEVYSVKAGDNHGWPEVKQCYSEQAGLTNPIFCSGTTTLAPSGGVFYGTSIWRFRYSFFFAGLRSGIFKRLAIIDGKVAEEETIIDGTYGRLRAVAVGPDGSFYVSTSNKDGRGKPTAEDDRILKLTPKLKQ